MEDLIEFKGILPAEELAKVISNSDFHIMFSNYENLPVVNLECFACGIPVLSSDVGGIKEHLNNRLGILTPQRDITKLVLNIENMMNNLSNYDSDYIRDYAIENFSKEKIGKLLTEIYNSVLGNNSTHVYPH